MRNYTEQTPTPPNEWLYKDEDENTRLFAKVVALPEGAARWNECTDAEKERWEEQHPDPEPEVSPDGEIEEAAATAETGETPDGKGESDQPANVPADPANEGKEAEV